MLPGLKPIFKHFYNFQNFDNYVKLVIPWFLGNIETGEKKNMKKSDGNSC